MRIYKEVILLLMICNFAMCQVSDKYLLPKNDSLAIIRIAVKDLSKYTCKVGEYSELCPIKKDVIYFLPKRVLYDPDMIEVKADLEKEIPVIIKLTTEAIEPKIIK